MNYENQSYSTAPPPLEATIFGMVYHAIDDICVHDVRIIASRLDVDHDGFLDVQRMRESTTTPERLLSLLYFEGELWTTI